MWLAADLEDYGSDPFALFTEVWLPCEPRLILYPHMSAYKFLSVGLLSVTTHFYIINLCLKTWSQSVMDYKSW